MNEKNVTRRDFLKSATFAVAGAALTAGLGFKPTAAVASSFEQNGDILTIVEDGVAYEISVAEENGVRTVTTVNTSTGSVDKIIYNIVNSTIYSTYTGKTVELSGELAPSDEDPLPGSPRSRTTYSTKNISYAQIKSAAGTIATTAGLASAILAFVPGASMAVSVAGLVGAVGSAVNGVVSPSTSHGVRVKIATTKYYRNGNHIPYRTVKQITEVSLY